MPVDYQEPLASFSGNWKPKVQHRPDYYGKYMFIREMLSNRPGDYAEMTYYGSRIQWVGSRNDNHGIIDLYPYPKLLQMILILMSHVISSLVREGYDIAPLMREIDLLQLQECRNRQELRQLILTQTGRVIDYLESLKERAANYGAGVRQALLFVEEHFAENISISDIADSIGISASHLSRIFKA